MDTANITQSGIINLAIIIIVMMNAVRGFRKGALRECSGVLAFILSLIFVREKGNTGLAKIFAAFMKIIGDHIISFGESSDYTNIYELYSGLFGNVVADKILEIFTFVVAFFLLNMFFRIIIFSVAAKSLPYVGKADSILGVIVGVMSSMCTIWAIMACLHGMLGNSPAFAQIVSNMDHGLFYVMYHNNPILRFVMAM